MSEFVPSELKVADLRKELAARDLPTTGLKKDLVQRLEEALAAAGTPVQSSGGGGEEEDEDEEENNDHIDLMPVEETTELEHDAPDIAMVDEAHSDEAIATGNDESAEMMDDDDVHEVERKRKAGEQASRDSHMETDDVAGALTQPTSGDSLYIKNLERPLTVYRLKEMLGKYGVVDDVWLNSIKTRGYASFEKTEQAMSAHAAINGKKFPPEHGKVLECGFITRTRVKELIVDEEASSEFVRNVDLVTVPVEGGNCGVALVNSKSSPASKKQKTDRVKGDKPVDKAATLAAETSVSLITAAAAAAANEAKSAGAHGRRDDRARRTSDTRGGESDARSPMRSERGGRTLVTKTQPRITYRPLTDEEVAAKKAGRTYA
ncbi:hypothetical protein GGI19_001988 [Coemansia pectinata]|uniref:SAP domain-containing protein n=1 Tax=Coemansia pectinata TaxID=1052879 RepID=A0A9W8LCN2_9FUNG|nr:hypothetical protein GGI19_001988 [Coemansia pectinata]